MRYQHTQRGTVIAASMLGGVVLMLVLWCTIGELRHDAAGQFIMGATAVILLACAVMFSSMTVAVDGGELRFWFGPGMLRWRVSLGEVVAVKKVRNHFWHGWGIHFVGGGWLYNVSGWESVEVRLRSGRWFRLGTDDPDGLIQVIESVIGGDGTVPLPE